MEKYMLLKYSHTWYCQGTEECDIDYALLDLSDILFSSYDEKLKYAKKLLISKSTKEIDEYSIEDITISCRDKNGNLIKFE